jgi:hypothetical protein
LSQIIAFSPSPASLVHDHGNETAFRALNPSSGPEGSLEDEAMKRLILSAAAVSMLALGGCATNPYGYDPYYGYNSPYGYNNGYYGNGYYGNGYYGNNSQLGNAATGAAIGAGTGAIAGAVLPGVSTGEGAIAGAILGGVLGAVVNGRQYYRDTRGYCYYVDQYGQPHYNYNTRC